MKPIVCAFVVFASTVSIGCDLEPDGGANSIACEQMDCPPGDATDFNLQARWEYTSCDYVDASGGFLSYIGRGCDGFAELCGVGPSYTLEELGPSGQGLAPQALASSNAFDSPVWGEDGKEFLVYANDERISACGPNASAATVIYCVSGSGLPGTTPDEFKCVRVFVALNVGTCTGEGLSPGDWNKSAFVFVRTPDSCP